MPELPFIQIFDQMNEISYQNHIVINIYCKMIYSIKNFQYPSDRERNIESGLKPNQLPL